jgi:hypothetical protein
MQQPGHPGDQLIVPGERAHLAGDLCRIRPGPDVGGDGEGRKPNTLAGAHDLKRHPDIIEQEPRRQWRPQLMLEGVQRATHADGAVPRGLAYAQPALEPPVALVQAIGVVCRGNDEGAGNRAHVR